MFCLSIWAFELESHLVFVDLVVASAGDDKKISLWRKNGQSMGTIPVSGADGGDNIEVVFCFIFVYCIAFLRFCCFGFESWCLDDLLMVWFVWEMWVGVYISY